MCVFKAVTSIFSENPFLFPPLNANNASVEFPNSSFIPIAQGKIIHTIQFMSSDIISKYHTSTKHATHLPPFLHRPMVSRVAKQMSVDATPTSTQAFLFQKILTMGQAYTTYHHEVVWVRPEQGCTHEKERSRTRSSRGSKDIRSEKTKNKQPCINKGAPPPPPLLTSSPRNQQMSLSCPATSPPPCASCPWPASLVSCCWNLHPQ